MSSTGTILLTTPLLPCLPDILSPGLNNSDDRRIGFVIQSYIGSNVDQVLGKMYVQKARGEDKYKYHEYSNIPTELMGRKEVISQNKANEELSKIFYFDSEKIGKY